MAPIADLICDTDPLATTVWAEFLAGAAAKLRDLARRPTISAHHARCALGRRRRTLCPRRTRYLFREQALPRRRDDHSW